MHKSDLSILVSNVLNENRYSHCRLCLRNIETNYVRFDDCVFLDVESETFQPLSEVLTTLLGAEVCHKIPGIDAVCTDCVDKTLQTGRFLAACQNSTKLLHKVFDNLTQTLNVDIGTTSNEQSMYVFMEEEESRIVLQDNMKINDSRVICSNQEFQCSECYEEFDAIEELKVHNIIHHGTITCDKCHQAFPNQTELESHENNGHEFICPNCLQYKTSEEDLKKHQENAHMIYVCKYCGKPCNGLQKLQSHEEKHITKSECPKCGKTYITKDFFAKHVKLCIENLLDPHPYRAKIKKTFFCEKCGKGYSTSGGLRVHDRFVHGNAKPHVCEHCGKQFTAPSYLKIHMVKHTGEKRFKCHICNNNFVSKEALLYHTRRHTGEKPYSCKLCSEKFVNASARAEHIKFKHAAPTLSCHICMRKFFTANFLRQHVNRHHDPSSKLYSGRSMIPPNMPGEQNMRVKFEKEEWSN